jgi:hypothetical protein
MMSRENAIYLQLDSLYTFTFESISNDFQNKALDLDILIFRQHSINANCPKFVYQFYLCLLYLFAMPNDRKIAIKCDHTVVIV